MAVLSDQVLALVTAPVKSTQAAQAQPQAAARALIDTAARRAALTAGALALPPGPLGWATLLPEMLGVWQLQRQLVADLAALHGRSASLGPTQMLWCLFRHTAAQALRDLAVRVGDRLLVQPVTRLLLPQLARAVGLQLGQQVLGRTVGRWVPLAGATAVAAYAYWDTRQVGRAACELFAQPPEAGASD
ncbi:MAG: hypothetical protein E6Q67_09285 [Roseateles sp.]|nr:MAG: hypothetical protein E6Q67_09285 [Roseateles sp.]